MKSFKSFALAGVAAIALAACGGGESDEAEDNAAAEADAQAETGQVPSVEEAQAAIDAQLQISPEEALERSNAFLEENAEVEGMVVTDTGLQFLSIEEGEGRQPTDEDVVVIHFIGTKTDGTVFDTSLARGQPATIPLSEFTEDAPGFVEGIKMMNVGGTAKFTVPPDLAYGAEGTPNGMIGPNEALTFEVQLLEAIDRETVDELTAEYEALAQANADEAVNFLAENKAKSGIQETSSGLQYQVMSEGPADGASPGAEDTVEVHYKGTLINGEQFDSSYDRDETATFPLGNVIAGWTEGLQLMSEGDKYRFFVPPELAYGPQARGDVIGPNSLLIFEVELVDVKDGDGAEAAQ